MAARQDSALYTTGPYGGGWGDLTGFDPLADYTYTPSTIPQQGGSYQADTTSATPTPATSSAQDDYYRWLMNQKAAPVKEKPDYSLQIAQMNAELQRQQMAQQAAQFAQDLAWKQEQQRLALEAERQQRLAELAAQPKSWLEYAALAGQAPVVQQWMKPLMPQEYQNLNVGDPIPGWNAANTAGSTATGLAPDWNMMGMPDLRPPSAQLLARMSPTAQEQYYGYMQADTGAPPDTSLWLRRSQAPPGSSRYTGLTQQR